MVERLLCKQDVSGSSPLTSTRTKEKIQHQHEKSENAGEKTPVKYLENCIRIDTQKQSRKKYFRAKLPKKVKLQRANGGYLGTQRRRRTWRPTIRSGELEASIEPEVSE